MSVSRLRRGLTGLAAALIVAVWQVMASAQEPQTEFVPADSLPQEVLPATPLVFAAYAFVWVALLVYVFVLWRRLGQVERELQDVRARLGAKGP